MATLTARKRRAPTFVIPRFPLDIAQRIMLTFWITAVGSIVTSATAVVGYLIYSGVALRMLAEIMVGACRANGSCLDFPAMLAGLSVGIMILFILAIIILSSLSAAPEDLEPGADEISLLNLLLTWYRIGPRERGALLEILDGSDVETDHGLRQLLYAEHRDLEAMDDERKSSD